MAALEPPRVSAKLKKLQAVVSKPLCLDVFYRRSGIVAVGLDDFGLSRFKIIKADSKKESGTDGQACAMRRNLIALERAFRPFRIPAAPQEAFAAWGEVWR